MSQVTQDGENGETSQEGGEGIDDRDDDGIPVNVVGESVVGRIVDDCSKADRQREE